MSGKRGAAMLQAVKAANNTNKEPSKEPKSKKPKNGNNGRDMPTNDESIRLAKAKKVAKAQKEEAMRVAERKLVAAADRSNTLRASNATLNKYERRRSLTPIDPTPRRKSTPTPKGWSDAEGSEYEMSGVEAESEEEADTVEAEERALLRNQPGMYYTGRRDSTHVVYEDSDDELSNPAESRSHRDPRVRQSMCDRVGIPAYSPPRRHPSKPYLRSNNPENKPADDELMMSGLSGRVKLAAMKVTTHNQFKEWVSEGDVVVDKKWREQTVTDAMRLTIVRISEWHGVSPALIESHIKTYAETW
jgi:hypothetical protein